MKFSKSTSASTRHDGTGSIASDAPATVHDGAVLVSLDGVAHRYGRVEALQPTDLEIRAGEFCALLGPSGSGKTTLLRLIGGFLRPSSGTIRIAGQEITNLPPERRPTNMVFQGYGLFPHMNARQNIGYGLAMRGVKRREAADKVERVMALVDVVALGDRAIEQLSGGQQQRVALARALVMEPAVLLLDEPLAALDLQLRRRMQEELRRIHREINGTFLFVTHDQGEAMALANRIAIMDRGRIVQIGTPREIYCNPESSFVSTFIGDANLFQAERRANRITTEIGVAFDDEGREGEVRVVVRPSELTVKPLVAPGEPALSGRIIDALFLGPCVQYAVSVDGFTRRLIVQDYRSGVRPFEAGDAVHVTWRPGAWRAVGSE